MKQMRIIARMAPDGSLKRIHEDGREEDMPMPAPLPRPSEEDIRAAALSDPDAQPLDFSKLRPVPRIKTLRRALGLTQEAFAAAYHIPVGTLRDWEQGRAEPDAPARAYLKIIAAMPDQARIALESPPSTPPFRM